MANNPPAPPMMLSEVLILPIMVLLTLLAGGYPIIRQLRARHSQSQSAEATSALVPAKNRRGWLKIPVRQNVVATVFVVLISMVHEGLGVLVAWTFGTIAMIRGLRLVQWGIQARTLAEKPDHLAGCHPARLIGAGVLLVVSTLFLVGLASAFFARFIPNSRYVEEELQNFVAHQLACAEQANAQSGVRRFRRILPEQHEGTRLFLMTTSYRAHTVKVDYGTDDTTFTVLIMPQKLPFFPYNYFAARPSYRGDHTGQIRMVRVHRDGSPCPPDAPVVMKVGQESVEKALHDLRQGRSRFEF